MKNLDLVQGTCSERLAGGFTGGRRPPTGAACPGPTSEEADEANLSTDLVFPHKTLKDPDL